MVNEFVLDDLSSSWTDSFNENKSKSKYTKGWRHFHIHICEYIYIYMNVAPQMHICTAVVKPCAYEVKVGASTVYHCKKSLRIILSVSVKCCVCRSKDALHLFFGLGINSK